MKRKKLTWLLLSVVLLVGYLGIDSLKSVFDDRVMKVVVCSQEKLDQLYKGKENTFIYPEITLNEGTVPYDLDRNMLLIPQNMSEENITGILDVPDGNLYFLEDEGFDNKLSSMSENRCFTLYWIRKDECWTYEVYLTGMPVMNLITNVCVDVPESMGGGKNLWYRRIVRSVSQQYAGTKHCMQLASSRGNNAAV